MYTFNLFHYFFMNLITSLLMLSKKFPIMVMEMTYNKKEVVSLISWIAILNFI